MLHLPLETLGIASGFAAIGVGWISSRYSEAAPAPFWTAYDESNWDLSGKSSREGKRTRAKLAAKALTTITALLGAGATAFEFASAHSDNRLVLAIATAIAGFCLTGGSALFIRHLIAVRLLRAREAFYCFYVGTGLHKYAPPDAALARFASDNPTCHRIAVHSIAADLKAGAA